MIAQRLRLHRGKQREWERRGGLNKLLVAAQLMVVLLCALALYSCKSTTTLGSERAGAAGAGAISSGGAAGMANVGGAAGTTEAPKGGAGASGTAGQDGGLVTDAGDATSQADGGRELACLDKPCGEPCGRKPSSDAGFALSRFCTEEGRCEERFPLCGPALACDVDGECSSLAMPLRRAGCLVCSDVSLACATPLCENETCDYATATCATGVLACATEANCPRPEGLGLIKCGPRKVSRPHLECIDAECVVLYSRCEEFDPCRGVPCGAPCQFCPPTEPNCPGGDGPHSCNLLGQCVLGDAVCQ